LGGKLRFIAIGLAVGLLSSCGGGGRTSEPTTAASISTNLPSTTTFSTTSTQRPTTTTAPGSSYTTKGIAFTTPDGWNYVYTPHIGIVRMTLTKDISTSPPGKAKLVSHLTISSGSEFPGPVVSTDTGRTAPQISFGGSSVEWPVTPEASSVVAACGLPGWILFSLTRMSPTVK